MVLFLIMVTAIATALSASACANNALRAKTRGEENERGLMLKSWVTVSVISLITHLIIYLLLFKPLTYVFMMTLVIIFEWLTIRVDSLNPGKTESMADLAMAWFYFGLGFEIGLLFAIAHKLDTHTLDTPPKAAFLLALLLLLVVVLVASIRLLIVEQTEYTPEVTDSDQTEDVEVS